MKTKKKPQTPDKNGKSHDWFWRALNDYLRDQGLKQSTPRSVVIERFLEMGHHVDAESLHQDLTRTGEGIGLATVYRTLQLLREAKLVEQKAFSDGRSLFELLDPHAHHDHMVCLTCGVVIEFENEDIEKLQHRVAEAHHFELARHCLDLYGYCRLKNCDRKARGEPSLV